MKAKVPAAVFDLFQGQARKPLLPTWNAQSALWEIKMTPVRFITTDGTHCRLLLKYSTFGRPVAAEWLASEAFWLANELLG